MTRFSMIVIAFAAACGGSSSPTPTAPAAGGAATAEAQIQDGAGLYGQYCADCHGADGSGAGQAPALVGPGALPLEPGPGAQHRTVPFRTAHDVFTWVAAHMPADAPGSLSAGQYAAILAFALDANGVVLQEPVTEPVARSIVLHP